MKNSRNLRGEALMKYKQSLTLSPCQKDIIVGTLLGDASMRLSKGKPVYAIKFEQGIQHKEYIEHLYQVFEPYCGTGPRERFVDKEETRKSIGFTTYRHNDFIFYYNYFYEIQGNKSVKVIRKDIHKFLTPKAVAYWFMGDGTYHKDNSGNRNYLFSTQGFQKSECQRLCDALKLNFNIDSNVHKDREKYRIYVISSSSQKLLDLMKPFIHNNFQYKL